jgi:hypothetical protein
LKSEFDCTEVRAPISKGLRAHTKVCACSVQPIIVPPRSKGDLKVIAWKGRASGASESTNRGSQQPGGGVRPGVAAAPVAFTGVIIAGLARSIEMFSLHAAEFGVGITRIAASTLVLPRSVMAGG